MTNVEARKTMLKQKVEIETIKVKIEENGLKKRAKSSLKLKIVNGT